MKPIVLLGEALGANEERIKSSFVGASGIELLRMLNDSGLLTLTSEDQSYISRFWSTSDPNQIEMVWRLHPEFYRTNVFNRHPQGNRIEAFCGPKGTALPGYPKLSTKGPGYVQEEYAPELDRLGDELIEVDPNLVIAMGNAALWALCGATGISRVRGTTRLSTHCAAGFKVLPTYHPAAVLRQWELRPTTVADFVKASRECHFPEIRRPEREIWIEPTLEDVEEFCAKYISRDCLLSVDIETAGNQITCIGFSPSPQNALVIPFYDSRAKDGSYWRDHQTELSVWKVIRRVLVDREIPKLFQNGLYDIAFLMRSVGIGVRGAAEDTMLLHHALQPESLKGLGYLGSIYSDESAWKTERRGTKTIKRDE